MQGSGKWRGRDIMGECLRSGEGNWGGGREDIQRGKQPCFVYKRGSGVDGRTAEDRLACRAEKFA